MIKTNVNSVWTMSTLRPTLDVQSKESFLLIFAHDHCGILRAVPRADLILEIGGDLALQLVIKRKI